MLPVRFCSRKDGFTLIELIIVIAILAILAAILVPFMVSYIDHAQLAACITNRQLVVRNYTYQVGLRLGIVEESGEGEILQETLRVCTIDPAGSTATQYQSPCGGVCTVTYSDDKTQILDISCSIHGSLSDEEGSLSPFERAWKVIDAITSRKKSLDEIVKYFITDKRGKGSTLDSGGFNFAITINNMLEEEELGNANSSYSIYRFDDMKDASGNTVAKFGVYWTDEDIEDQSLGSTVRYARKVLLYNTVTKEWSLQTDDDGNVDAETGTISIGSKTVGDSNGKQVQIHVLDVKSRVKDKQAGDAWTE